MRDFTVRHEPRPRDMLAELAHRIERLCPDHRDPERFHIEKSEIAYDLTRLAERLAS